MKIAVCLYVRDEERDIAEWLAFHIAVGFDCCIVYDNGSVDGTPEIAEAFGQVFDVRLVEWPYVTRGTQARCYADCLAKFGDEFDWIAFVDADELLVPRAGTIRTLLAPHVDTAAVLVNWAIYGSRGHVVRPPGLMLETFTRRAKSDFVSCRIAKFIVRPSKVLAVQDPCSFILQGCYRSPSGRPANWEGVRTVTAEHSVAQLNHYFTRSRDEWDQKRRRGYRGNDQRRTTGRRQVPRVRSERSGGPVCHAICSRCPEDIGDGWR